MEALRIIKSKFKKTIIINPRNHDFTDMDDFCALVRKCDMLVAQPLSKNVLTAGVRAEIETAFKFKIPVFCLDLESRKISKIKSLKHFKCLSVEETRHATRTYFFVGVPHRDLCHLDYVG